MSDPQQPDELPKLHYLLFQHPWLMILAYAITPPIIGFTWAPLWVWLLVGFQGGLPGLLQIAEKSIPMSLVAGLGAAAIPLFFIGLMRVAIWANESKWKKVLVNGASLPMAMSLVWVFWSSDPLGLLGAAVPAVLLMIVGLVHAFRITFVGRPPD